jgi:hypothetical protein
MVITTVAKNAINVFGRFARNCFIIVISLLPYLVGTVTTLGLSIVVLGVFPLGFSVVGVKAVTGG